MSGHSLFEKVWQDHLVVPESPDNPAVFYIDLHLIHEVTTPQAFDMLRERGLPVRRPDLTLATMDHSTPTVPLASLGDLEVVAEPAAAGQIRQMIVNCKEFGIDLLGFFQHFEESQLLTQPIHVRLFNYKFDTYRFYVKGKSIQNGQVFFYKTHFVLLSITIGLVPPR